MGLMGMNKSQITIIAILATLTVAVLCGIGFVTYSTMTHSTGVTSQPAADQPAPATVVPTITPIPTWTPTLPPTSVPTPDVRAEVEAYLDELYPLLNADIELWEEWETLYSEMTFEYCTANKEEVRPRYRDLQERQAEINNMIIALAPPKPLEHTHQLLVSAIRHEAQGDQYTFNGCMEEDINWWEAANIEWAHAEEDRQAAFDEMREVLDELDIEQEDGEEKEKDWEYHG
jgi:hypothetical protein